MRLKIAGEAGSETTSKIETVHNQVVEIVSDSGEGAQTAGKMFGALNAKEGNAIWTVELIPAEIEPPARSRAGASGNRIRFSSKPVTNQGDTADVVVAFNEQVLYSRIDQGAYGESTTIYLEKKWGESPIEEIREQYAAALAEFKRLGFEVVEVPMEEECLEHTSNPRRGKNMWVVGFLCGLYCRNIEAARTKVEQIFKRKGQKVVDSNLALLDSGYAWALANLDVRYEVPPVDDDRPMLGMNGNQALGLGCMAAGLELCSMYPITPATSASHYLAASFQHAGGVVHQAEDEIAAVGFAIGASYAGKTAVTITSGPGLALKSEMLGLAVMAEIPLVVIDVQRGGPSTGLPTKVEQADLLAAIFGQTGDAPRIVLAPSTLEECFHHVILARRLAETFRGPVLLLSDANLATGLSLFPRPEVQEEWLSPPVDQAPWQPGLRPYDWDPETGVSPRPVPGQKGGNYILTGLAHDEESHVAYASDINQRACEARSRKLATLATTLKPPAVHGDAEGDLLVVGWGSTRGSIEEAVDRVREAGKKVSSIHLTFLSPLEPGLEEIFARFKKVMTVEINYSDPFEVAGARKRPAQLALLLRGTTLVDVDSFSRVPGAPFPPAMIEAELLRRLGS